ncbi:serine hydrolase BPHL-like isoform X1 [Tachypleus tridentatus]|uniref:serine hydrolase BPHL-like isoform X1 n=1 Tax=Tachypleus tridentatus TaxID=6853 RepID=UPI003FD4C66F
MFFSKAGVRGLVCLRFRMKLEFKAKEQLKQYSNFKNLGKKIKIGDTDLHFEKVGSGPHHVLLLPGALGSAQTDFKPQLNGLSHKKFSLVAWDPPGYGHSRPPQRKFSTNFFYQDAELAVALMEKLEISKFSILGWSDGATTGLIIAGRYPDKVHKLCTWGGGSYATKEDVDKLEDIRDVSRWSVKMREPMVGLYGKDYFQQLWNEYCDAFQLLWKHTNGDICCEELSNIECPTLIIFGEKDYFFNSDHLEFLLKNIKNTKLHKMADGKHNLHLHFAKEFNTLVEEFLSNP